MKIIPLLLLAVLGVGANPFHLGASWEWKIFDQQRNQIGTRIAQVVDAEEDPESGAPVWVLRIADSANQAIWDTGSIVDDTLQGARYWGRGSSRLPLEPRGFDSLLDGGEDTNWGKSYSPHYKWGVGSFANRRVRYDDEIGILNDPVPGFIGLRFSIFEASEGFAMPNLVWDSALGWTRAKWWSLASSTGVPSVPLEDWILVAKDGKQITEKEIGPLKTMAVPAQGSVWSWEEIVQDSLYNIYPGTGANLYKYTSEHWTKESRATIRWEFKERPADSSGWVRALVEERVAPAVGNAVVKTISLRWNPLTGARFPVDTGKNCRDLAGGFWFDWSDSRTAPLRYRLNYKYGGAFGLMVSSLDLAVLRSSGGLDSGACDNRRINHFAEPKDSYKLAYYRLFQVDDTVIRDALATGVRFPSGRREVGLGDLLSLARRYPSAMVSIRDVRGTTRVQRLDQFQVSRPGRAAGVRWLEVTLPDGSVRRGAIVN